MRHLRCGTISPVVSGFKASRSSRFDQHYVLRLGGCFCLLLGGLKVEIFQHVTERKWNLSWDWKLTPKTVSCQIVIFFSKYFLTLAGVQVREVERSRGFLDIDLGALWFSKTAKDGLKPLSLRCVSSEEASSKLDRLLWEEIWRVDEGGDVNLQHPFRIQEILMLQRARSLARMKAGWVLDQLTSWWFICGTFC